LVRSAGTKEKAHFDTKEDECYRLCALRMKILRNAIFALQDLNIDSDSVLIRAISVEASIAA
jgi:hypothetical protein